MSDQDQLERDVEAALARLTTAAVPDTRHPPAPPWQERRRVADVRRFGRATPWLVAAVLLVLAGLGIGAGVAFDAAPSDRAPVGTRPASPSQTATGPNGTLGTTAAATPDARPSSHATLERPPNGSAPDDGVGPFVAGPGTYGPLRVGMTEVAALAALGLGTGDLIPGNGTCSRDVPLPGATVLGDPPRAVVADAGGTVIGFVTAKGVRDALGNGAGTTLATLRADYPTGTVVQSQTGWVFVVDTAAGSLGFALDSLDAPTDSSTALALMPGVAEYARGYEVCG